MGRLIIGFLAGALAVLLAHQPIIMALKSAGMIQATATVYNMGPVGHAPGMVANLFKGLGFPGFPTLFNQMFWGGLLGSIFGMMQTKLPGGLMILKGLIYGLIVVVISNWMMVPLIKGVMFKFPNQPFFADFNSQRMLVGAIIQAGFGAATGLLYSLFRR
jgi:hypothetical protein